MQQTKTETTKLKLLKTTARLIRQQGYNATGISQILAESGVPKGSLYYHFPQGKIELTVGAVNLANETIGVVFERITHSTYTAEEAVQAYCDYYLKEMEQGNFEKGCPFATVTLEASPFVEPIQLACKAAFDHLQGLLEALLIRDGLPDSEASNLALMVLASIEGGLILSKAQKTPDPLQTICQTLTSQIRSTLEPYRKKGVSNESAHSD